MKQDTPKLNKGSQRSSVHLTIARVIELVRHDPDLSDTKKTNIRSSIKRFAGFFNLDIEHDEADIRMFRRLTHAFHPRSNGVSEKRWQNIRAEVEFAINRYRFKPRTRGQLPLPLSDEWKLLRDELGENKSMTAGLSRFMNYCSRHDVSPTDVSDETMGAFREWIETSKLSGQPQRVQRTSIRLWNKARTEIGVWPSNQLTLPKIHDHYTIKWAELPQSFQDEADAWFEMLATGRTARRRKRRKLRPASIKTRRFQVLQTVSALKRQGVDPTTLQGFADIVTPDRVDLALDFLETRSNSEQSSMLFGIASCLLAIARHWVNAPKEQIEELKEICNAVKPDQNGMSDKNWARLQQFEIEDNQSKILLLPLKIYERLASSDSEPNSSLALLAQKALAVELLLFTSLRRENLSHLHLDEHFREETDRGVTRLFVTVPRGEVKNKERLSFELTGATVEMFFEYRDRHRFQLVQHSDDRWLFPGQIAGSPKSPEQLGRNISGFVRQETGLTVNAHLFRHLMVFIFLINRPGNYETARQHLGHKSLRTLVTYYAGLEMRAASQEITDVLLGLRDKFKGGD